MDTELPPQESEGTSLKDWNSFTRCRLFFFFIGTKLKQRFLSCFVCFCSDLFQDLSQLQETWLTEGETSCYGVSFKRCKV